MLRTDLPDHRRSTDAELLDALRGRDPLALAEAYHRTVPAAHAVARRLFSSSTDVEALLRAVYGELWTAPPEEPLEAWTRQRTFTLGRDELGERDLAPASPSLASLVPDLPSPDVRFLDAAERALADLDGDDRRVLLTAHDRGLPSWEQPDTDAGARLHAALLALAGPETSAEPDAGDGCTDVEALGDWVLGLVDADRAQALSDLTGQRPDCAAVARALRRGRRRLEGLPATPDMGQRVLVSVLAAAGGTLRMPSSAQQAGSALDISAPDAETTGELEPIRPAVRVGGGLAAGTTTEPGDDAAEATGDREVWGPPAAGGEPRSAAEPDVDDAGTSEGEGDPYRELGDDTLVDEDHEAPDGEADASSDEVVWEFDDLEDPDDAPSMGRRALRVLGWLLLIAAGSVVGLYLGTILVS